MKPKIIRTTAEYEAALERIDALMDHDPEPVSAAGAELDLLTLLVERYEEEQFPMDLPDPLSAIKFRMEQQGLKNKDLVPFLGSPSKVSEVMSGQRNLSLAMIRNLVIGLGIPAEVLIGQRGSEAATISGSGQKRHGAALLPGTHKLRTASLARH